MRTQSAGTCRICMTPSPRTPDMLPGGVGQVAFDYIKGLSERGFEFTSSEDEADVIAVHASFRSTHQPDVFHCHGFYPTSIPGFDQDSFFRINQILVQNALHAQVVTCVSEWSADILRRDLAVAPQVIRNGIWMNKYSPAGNSKGPVLWPKSSVSPTCDPSALLALAQGNSGLSFVSLAKFASRLPNLKQLSVLPHTDFIRLLSGCSVLLGTTRENGSIAIMESLACGVPVVGYDIGANHETLVSGTGCELVPFGDTKALDAALHKVLGSWQEYSRKARLYAEYNFDWAESMDQLANLYNGISSQVSHKISIVIPSHNYQGYLSQAISSALDQTIECEVIVVDDASTDGSADVALGFVSQGVKVSVMSENAGVAAARNRGIRAASGDLIVCLDADDYIDPDFIACLLPAFNDRSVGIAYAPIRVVKENGDPTNTIWFQNDFIYFDQASGRNQVPSCCMFRKDLWLKTGGYRQVYAPAEDARFWLDITVLGYNVTRTAKKPKMSYRMHDSQVHRQGFPDWWLDKPSRLNSPSLPLSYKVQNYDQPQLTFVLQMDDLAQAPAVLVTLASLFRLTSRNWQVIVRYNSVELVRSQVLKSLDGLQAFPFVELRRTTERLEVLSPSVWEVDPGQAVTQAALDLHLNDISQGFSGCFMPLSPTYWTVERGLLDAAHA